MVGTVAFLLALLIGGAVSNLIAPIITYFMGWGAYPWLAYLLVFGGGYAVSMAILTALFSIVQLAGGGIWSFSPVRLGVGGLGLLFRVVLVIWAFWTILIVPGTPFSATLIRWLTIGGGWLLHPVESFFPWMQIRQEGVAFDVSQQGIWPSLSRLAIVYFWIAMTVLSARWLKAPIAYVALPFQNLWRAIRTGVGGSSSFNGLLDDWRMRWKKGGIILGTSMYEPRVRIGVRDDRHMITVATSRAGKGRSCVIPNLLTWPGPVLVVDPKGENAAVTAVARRRDLGQAVHIVDPFGVLARLGLDQAQYPAHRYNPLDEIELDDLEVVEHIRNLGAALVMPSPNANPFWDEASRKILAGVISHVLTWSRLEPGDRHLGTVRDYVAGINGRDIFDDLKINRSTAAGGLHMVAVTELERASTTAGSDILTTLGVHMEWMDSLAMRRCMEASDFSIAELKTTNTSLYLVIPPEHLETHARYLRLFITQALRAAGRTKKSKHPMLFVLDEFASLGYLKVVEQASAQSAGAGVKLWPIIQNISQLKQYGDNWETFLANTGVQQVFAMNDQATARYFSERLGQHIAWRKVKTREQGKGGATVMREEWVPQGATFLRTHVELARASSRDSGRTLLFFEGGSAALLSRSNYDKIFPRNQYSRNPYQDANLKDRLQAFEDSLDTAPDRIIDNLIERLLMLPFVLRLDEWQTNRAKRRSAAFRDDARTQQDDGAQQSGPSASDARAQAEQETTNSASAKKQSNASAEEQSKAGSREHPSARTTSEDMDPGQSSPEPDQGLGAEPGDAAGPSRPKRGAGRPRYKKAGPSAADVAREAFEEWEREWERAQKAAVGGAETAGPSDASAAPSAASEAMQQAFHEWEKTWEDAAEQAATGGRATPRAEDPASVRTEMHQ